jgi:hypothetical protein
MFNEDDIMTTASFRLMQYHQRIDREFRAEIARRWPDGFRVQKLKRLKLAVKDRLQNYARAIRADKAQ